MTVAPSIGRGVNLLPAPLESVRRHWLTRFAIVLAGLVAATACEIVMLRGLARQPVSIAVEVLILVLAVIVSLIAAAAYIFANYGFERPYQSRRPITELERGRLRSDRILACIHVFLLTGWPGTYLSVRFMEGQQPALQTAFMTGLSGLAIGYFTLEVLSARGWRWRTRKHTDD
jgi:hypothetical protein